MAFQHRSLFRLLSQTTSQALVPVVVAGLVSIFLAFAAKASIDQGPTQSLSRWDAPAIAEFVDRAITKKMAAWEIPGAVAAVVTSADIVFLKGYGAANAAGAPVSPEETLLRIGSTSKLFTATAIMQLAERGLIDLDADIRTYLRDLAFDDRLGPISTADLLSHQAGFEDRLFGYLGAHPSLEGLSVAEQLEAIAPRQVRAPGSMPAYSNFSYALLGAIIESISGRRYADYLAEEVFEPLAMERTSARLKFTRPGSADPKTERLREAEAQTLISSGGDVSAIVFPRAPWLAAPEGGVSTTARDISAFMQAYLEPVHKKCVRVLNSNERSMNSLNCVLDMTNCECSPSDDRAASPSILDKETIAMMRAPLQAQAADVASNAYGFWRYYVGDVIVYGHDGEINGFHTQMVLAPSLDLGVFISSNGPSGRALKTIPRDLIRAMAPPDFTTTATKRLLEASRYEGCYAASRRNHTRFEKLINLAFDPLCVEEDNGDIVLFGERFISVAPDRFRSASSGERIAFLDTPDRVGRAAEYILFSNGGTSERQAWKDSRTVFLIASVLALLASIWLLKAGLLTPHHAGLAHTENCAVTARIIVVLAGLAWLVHLTSLAMGFVQLDRDSVYREFPTLVLTSASYAFVAAGTITTLLVLSVFTSAARRRDEASSYICLPTFLVLIFTYIYLNWNVQSIAIFKLLSIYDRLVATN